MSIFELITSTEHAQVLFCQDSDTALKAIIAIHDASFGRAMGATRLWPYASEQDALRDVLRLSQGMTYKAACAGIPVGGAKGVIIADPRQKTDTLLAAYARFVEGLNGQFITGQDVNLSLQDVQTMRQITPHIVGVAAETGGPVLMTAIGVVSGIQAAIQHRWGQSSLSGLKVAVQGVGNVGAQLCRLLHAQGAQLLVSDVNAANLKKMHQDYGAMIVDPQEIYHVEADVFAPCALGGVLNSHTIPLLKAPIIAGSANNQLADEDISSALIRQQNILYCPDYVINAGGLINVYHEFIGYNVHKANQMLGNIYTNLLKIFEIAEDLCMSTQSAAQHFARTQRLSSQPWQNEHRRTAA
jgi:leucine dehydrogenase